MTALNGEPQPGDETVKVDPFDGVRPSIYPALVDRGGAAVPLVAIEVPITADPPRGRFVTQDPATAMLTPEDASRVADQLEAAGAEGEVSAIELRTDSGRHLTVWPVDLEHQAEMIRSLRLHVEIAHVTARAVDAHSLLSSLGDPGAAEHIIDFAFEEGCRAAGHRSAPTRELRDEVRALVLESTAIAVAVMSFDPRTDSPTQTVHADAKTLLLGAGYSAAFAYQAGLGISHIES